MICTDLNSLGVNVTITFNYAPPRFYINSFLNISSLAILLQLQHPFITNTSFGCILGYRIVAKCMKYIWVIQMLHHKKFSPLWIFFYSNSRNGITYDFVLIKLYVLSRFSIITVVDIRVIFRNFHKLIYGGVEE